MIETQSNWRLEPLKLSSTKTMENTDLGKKLKITNLHKVLNKLENIRNTNCLFNQKFLPGQKDPNFFQPNFRTK